MLEIYCVWAGVQESGLSHHHQLDVPANTLPILGSLLGESDARVYLQCDWQPRLQNAEL